jgi:hypothetical protein
LRKTRLCSPRSRRKFERGEQFGAEAFLQLLAPRVDHAHAPACLGHGALGQLQQAVAAGPGVMKGLQRGRRGAEHDRDVALLRAPDRHVARRVAQAFLLLEGGIVLFVDHDQAQPRQRHEDREAGAEHDVGTPGLGIEEAARPCRIGHAAVGAHDVGAGKARGDAAFELRREGDFRHQHQRLAAAGQYFGDGAQIDLGLAAAGHAMQQEGLELARRGERRHRRLLRRQQSGQRGNFQADVSGACALEGILGSRRWRHGDRGALGMRGSLPRRSIGRQGEGRDLAQRRLVIASAEFAQGQPVRWQCRHVAQNCRDRFQLVFRLLAVRA